MRQSDIKLEIGNRYLIECEVTRFIKRKDIKTIIPEEASVIEFSTSGLYVKLQFPTYTEYDNKFDWRKVDEVKVMEQLENQNTIPF